MIHLLPILAFGEAFTPIFIGYLWKQALGFDKVSLFRQMVCRIVETYPKVDATFRKYAAKQGMKPLSKPQNGGKQA